MSEQKPLFVGILIGAICVLSAILFEVAEPLFLVAVLICGTPIVFGALIGVFEDHDITADVLVSIAIVAACLIGEYEAAAEISVIMQIGSFLEEATVNRANKRLSRLESLTPDVARIVDSTGERTVPTSEVKVGDMVRVVPGETIPVDGIVRSGSSSIDASMLTGESVPIDVAEGNRVSSGTVNMFGSLDIETDRVGEDATAAHMARMLDIAGSGKPRIVRTADRWAAYIVVIALSISVLTLLLTGDVHRAVTVLVVFCPCALILATPTAIMAAAGNLSKQGILVRNGNSLEAMAGVDTMLMDKTGTLTFGSMTCMGFESTSENSPEDLAELASAVESRSEHPLGKAIASFAKNPQDADSFEYLPGKGVIGDVHGRTVVAGNVRLMMERCPENLDATVERGSIAESDGYSVVYIGIDEKTAGFAMVADRVRDGSSDAVSGLREMGLTTIMLTGDTGTVARRVSSDLGMDDVVWECLPEDKLRTVRLIGEGRMVCMIGDGVNDAPSLKQADVGIAMGGIGSGLAKNSADIVFVNDDISKVKGVLDLSRRTILTIKAGIAFSLALNSIAMVLAVMGAIGPVAGALVHNIGSVIVIIAAAMLLRYDCWSPECRPSGTSTVTERPSM